MINRDLHSVLVGALVDSSAVALLGPRRAGKTTVAREISDQHNADQPVSSIYLGLESSQDRQKLADPEAYLLAHKDKLVIFDEATSALDSANKRAIQAELRTTAQNKTTLVIAHRLSTVVDAHVILVMEDGRIVERGTHVELLALDQKYAKMWNLQQSAE